MLKMHPKWKINFSAALIILVANVFHCAVGADLRFINYTCTIRFELADALRKEQSCSMIKAANSFCQRDIQVSFANQPPYIFVDTVKGKRTVRGIMPGM